MYKHVSVLFFLLCPPIKLSMMPPQECVVHRQEQRLLTKACPELDINATILIFIISVFIHFIFCSLCLNRFYYPDTFIVALVSLFLLLHLSFCCFYYFI